jgi:hypothetical protein
MDSRATIDHTGTEPVDPPISIAHLMRTLRGYTPVIVLTLLSATIVYALGIVAYMIAKPSQTTTSIRFRLNFTGADKGTYPNGARFNASTIISSPVLLKVYRANDLGRFVTFGIFTQSIVVLEANPALERLNTEYQARMADPKLTPIDRDRLSREFDAKRDSLGKNEYAINYTRGKGSIPEDLARKVLSDTLVTWANDASNEQRLFDYPMSVISPDILNSTPAEANGPMISLLILRSNISRVLLNLTELQDVPGANLVRTASQKMSLLELRIRLDDMLRFRIDPLIAAIRTGGLIRNQAAVIQFLESQLTYDQYQLRDLQQKSDAIRTAMSVYTMSRPQADTRTGVAQVTPQAPKGAGETITPVVNDSFIDRLVAMSNQPDEIKYRQKAADDYQKAILASIPAQQAVDYDKEMLDLVKRAPTGGSPSPVNDIETIRTETRGLVAQLNEIYQILSRTINPASQVYSVTQAPTTTIQRTGDLRRSGLGLLLVLLITLPVAVIMCLLHNRVREEETAEKEELVPVSS